MNFINELHSTFRRNADASACIKGSDRYPGLKGTVEFYQLCGSVLVMRNSAVCLPKILFVMKQFLHFISTRVPHAREMQAIRLRTRWGIITRTTARIRITPEICRRCLA